MRARQVRRVFHADSLFDLGIGVLLLLAGWEDLYRALGLPPARPPIFAQLLGVALFGFAYLLWVAPDYASMSRRVAEVAAAGNGASSALLLLWLATGPSGLSAVGLVVMLLLAAGLGVFAVLEARIAGAP
jgi:hypothetical protein